MATTATLTGTFTLPNDAAPDSAVLSVTLSAMDTDQNTGDVLPDDGSFTIALVAGAIPAGRKIWKNTAGLRGTHYRATLAWTASDGRLLSRYLGSFQVGDDASYDMADLLDQPPIATLPEGWYSTLTQGDYDAAITARDEAVAAAAAAEADAAATAADRVAVAEDAAYVEAESVGTRASMVTSIAGGFVPRNGRAYILDGVSYVGSTGSTEIPGLHGLTHGPEGVAPDHFGGKNKAAIEAAWALACAKNTTGVAADVAQSTAVPFLFLSGRYNVNGTSVILLETAGTGQRIEFKGNSVAYHLSIRLRRKRCEVINPYLIGGTYDMVYGIQFAPDDGESIRGGFITNPRIFNIRNAAKTAAGIDAYGNAAHIAISNPWIEGCDFSYRAMPRYEGEVVGGALFDGGHFIAARVNHVRITSGGENRFETMRIRGAEQEGVLITGATGQIGFEQYFSNCGITANHTDLTTRASNTITSITDDGGYARVNFTGSHMFWAGLRSCRIQGTGVSAYDDTTDVRCIEVGTDYVVTNVAYVSNATGTIVHCGFDVKLSGTDLVAQVNDITFTGGNINSVGLFYAYNISFTGTRLKVNAWASDSNRIIRMAGFRGREGDPSWDDVQFVGQATGILEFGASVPEGSDRNTVPTLVMRTPRTSSGLSGNSPVAYNSVGVSSDNGVKVEGTAIISSPATALDETAGRALRVGDFGLAVSGQDLAPDVSSAKNARAVARARKDARRRATLQNWRFGATAWEPISGLGAKLVAWWDVDTYATLMTDDGAGLISSWTDRILGRAITATGSARPTYSATGLYGRPCVAFDGVANYLTTSTLTGLPTGSTAGGLVAVTGPWVAAATTHAAGYGSSSAGAARRISTNTGGLAVASNGATAQTGTTANVPLNILIAEWNVTTASLYQNGVTSSDSPEAVTMNTATSYFRVGASLVATPNQFTAIQITDIMVINGILTPYERKKLEGFLAWKRAGGQELRPTHPHYDHAPLAGSRPKSSRPYRYVTSNNQRMSGATAAVGVNTGFKGRIVELIGGDDCSEIRVGFSNWYIDNQETSAAETDNADAVTLSKLAVVYDGVSVPLTFDSGSRSVVLAAGETLKLSDVVEAASFGFDRFRAGTVFEVRYMGTVASSSSVMLYNERGSNEFSSTIKEQGFHYPSANAVDDIDALGNMATPTGNIGNLIIGPTAIIGRFDSAPPVIDVFADSIPHGLRDFVSGGVSSNGVGGATGAVNGGGWVRRALMSLGLSYSLTSKVGHRYQHMAANYAKRATFFKYSTHAMFTLGTNDLNASITAADIFASATPIWAAYRAAGGQGVYHATIVPRVAANAYLGTDLENQEPGAPYVAGGERDKFNTILQNNAPGLLNAVADVARAVSDPRDQSRWAVPDFEATLAADVTSASTAFLLSTVPEVELCLVLEPGEANAEATTFNVISVSGNTAQFSAAPIALSHSTGAVVKATLAGDGTHPSAQAHYLMSLVAMPVIGDIEDAL